ncbi:MAG: ADP-ribosylglycohydrolase family protein, partial [Bacilli bacterium]|nr:ADP-ribosylglycohydrolase family protein [Bacilli bacterium]
KEEAYNELKYKDYSSYSEESVEKYNRILSGNLKEESEDTIKSTGYVVDSLEAALWCTLNSNSYEDAVVKAVNLGDDTDTVGAITGSMVGTIYGAESIPERWISKVRKLDELKSIATGYCDVVCDNNTKVSPRYYDNLAVSYDEELYRMVNGLDKPDDSEKKTNVL